MTVAQGVPFIFNITHLDPILPQIVISNGLGYVTRLSESISHLCLSCLQKQLPVLYWIKLFGNRIFTMANLDGGYKGPFKENKRKKPKFVKAETSKLCCLERDSSATNIAQLKYSNSAVVQKPSWRELHFCNSSSFPTIVLSCLP